MQWRDTETGNMGGIRIKADHKAYLVKDALGTPVEDVDPEKAAFTLKEGCWNWIVTDSDLGRLSSRRAPIIPSTTCT